MVATGRAVAYLTSNGFVNASAAVGALGAPTITGGTAGAGTVALSWTPVAAPAGGTVTYYVTRAGGTVGGNCPSSSATATSSTSCTDSGLTRGTYNYTVTAIWRSWSATSASSPVSVSSGPLDHFTVVPPGSVTAGGAFSATITAADAAGNPVVAYAGSQAITFSGPASAPNGQAPAYPGAVSFNSGQGSASITLYDAQTTTLTATQGSVGGTSASFTVGAGNNHQIAVTAPGTATAGTSFTVTLTAQDSWGNLTGNLAGTKSMSFSGPSVAPIGGAAGTPQYPATVTFNAGVASSVSVTLKDAQTTTLTASDTTDGYAGVASGSIAVAPTNPSTFTVPTPAAQTAGRAFSVTLTAYDAYGNQATGYSGSQTVTFSGPTSAPNGKTPDYTEPVSFNSGVGTASMTLYDAQSTTLTATQVSVSGTSGSFTVAPGTTGQIATSAPGTATAGTSFTVRLTAQDSWGNVFTTLSGSRSMSYSGPSPSPNASTPVYTSPVTFSAGVANSVPVTLKDAQTTTITATDTTDGYAGIPSGNIVVSPNNQSALNVATPTTQTAGTAFTETVTAIDAYGNTATGYAGSKSITFSGPANSPSSTAPTYPASVTFNAGVANASITLYDAQTTTLTATRGTLTGTSGSFTVQAATTASALVFTTQPGNVTHGAAFGTQPVVTAKDAYGNVATAYNKTVTLSGFSGPGTLTGCIPSLSNGVTTYTGCTVSTRGSGYVLKASDGTLSVNSTSFTAA